jgi:hypothetical protein
MSSDVQGRLQENLQENSGTTHRKTSKKTQAPHTGKTSKKTRAPHTGHHTTSMDRMHRVAAQQQFHLTRRAALSMDAPRSAQDLRGLVGGSGLPRVFHQTVG